MIETNNMEIPGYTILRELGRGGMATVYLANQDKLHRKVALKVMRSTVRTDEDFTARFNKEGRIIAQLAHRQIVTIYDFNSYQNHRYFSMEYLPGGTLAERIQQGLTVEQTLATIRIIAEALSYAHKRGVVHRDLKPQNIMFREDDTPVLTDFGIARVVKANSETIQLTQLGTAIGSPRYMSPEQITGQPVDARADLYSLGIVFFEMLTKELPYYADDVISLAMMHCSSPIPPLPDKVANFQSILDKLIAKEADDRFADAEQFIQALDQADSLKYQSGSDHDRTYIVGAEKFINKLSSNGNGRPTKRIVIVVLFLLFTAAVAAYLVLSRAPKPHSQGTGIELQPAQDDRPSTAVHYENLAIAHYRRGELEQSLNLIRLGLSITPADPKLKVLQTRIKTDLNVSQLLQKAIKLDEEDLPEQSLELVQQGLAPPHPGLLALRGQIVAKLEQRDHIARLLGACSSRFPLDLPLRDKAEAAIACYQQILELDPKNAQAGSKQSEIIERIPAEISSLLQEGDLGMAEDLIALLMSINPQHPELPALHQAKAAAMENSIALDLSQRRMVQTWLNALGYPTGEPDGAFRAKTRRAISAFQGAAGLEATGFLSAEVHARLEEQGSIQLRHAMLPPMVSITGGCFQMGSPVTEEARDNDERQHKVCIDSFRLGTREITVKEFRRFVEATDYQTDAERNAWGEPGCWALDAQDLKEPWRYRSWASWHTPNKYQKSRDDHPVTCVSWNDAQSYVDWLRRESGTAVRLPTEAEWEYAARAGTTNTRFWEAKADQSACSFASIADSGHQWADGFPCDDGHDWVAPVGGRQPNPWGLYDIFGNVWEWTCSAYDREYGGNETKCTKTDIEVPRVLRGGSWYSGPPAVRAAYRDRNYLGTRFSFLGFRLAED